MNTSLYSGWPSARVGIQRRIHLYPFNLTQKHSEMGSIFEAFKKTPSVFLNASKIEPISEKLLLQP